jgi:hypothetical protein
MVVTTAAHMALMSSAQCTALLQPSASCMHSEVVHSLSMHCTQLAVSSRLLLDSLSGLLLGCYPLYIYCTAHYCRQMPQELWADDSVVWSRDYSSPDSVEVTPATVTKLEEVRNGKGLLLYNGFQSRGVNIILMNMLTASRIFALCWLLLQRVEY